MNDKVGLAIGISIVVLVILTMAVYLLNAGQLDTSEYAMAGIVVIIVLGAAFILYRRFKSVKSGMPAEDEMSKIINYKAGYYAFIVAIWSSLGVGWANEIMVEEFGAVSLLPRHVGFIILLITGLAFVLSYLLLSRKGNV